jgi:hypothetical protein
LVHAPVAIDELEEDFDELLGMLDVELDLEEELSRDDDETEEDIVDDLDELLIDDELVGTIDELDLLEEEIARLDAANLLDVEEIVAVEVILADDTALLVEVSELFTEDTLETGCDDGVSELDAVMGSSFSD